MNSLRAFIHEDGGATVVEFALVTPVLILLLVACLDLARALNVYVIVVNASREGARYATVHPALANEENSLARWSAVGGYIASRVAPLDPDGLSGAVTFANSSDEGWTAAAAPRTVTVEVRYTWTAATWFVGYFFSGACNCRTFAASSSMQVVR